MFHERDLSGLEVGRLCKSSKARKGRTFFPLYMLGLKDKLLCKEI